MKPTVTILVCILAAGLASAQSPSIIQNTRNTMNAVSRHETAASNEALGIHQPARAAASATHAPAKPSGVAVVKPVKSSSLKTTASPAGTKHAGPAKRVPVVAARHGASRKPTVAAPKSNPPAAAKGTGQALGNGE